MNQTKRTIEDVIEDAKANGSTLKASEAAAIIMGAIIAINDGSEAAESLKRADRANYENFVNSLIATVSINLAVCGKTEAESLEYISSICPSPNARVGMAIIQEKGGQA